MKTILILTAAVAMMIVATMFAPPATAQCIGGRCYGVPQTIYRPRIVYDPLTYRGTQIMSWNRRAPIRNGWAGTPGLPRRTPVRNRWWGPPVQQYHFYIPQPQQQAPQPQAGQ